MVEPQDLATSRPPRHPHVPAARPNLDGVVETGLLPRPHGHQCGRAGPKDASDLPQGLDAIPFRREVMDDRDNDCGGERLVVEGEPADVPEAEARGRELAVGDLQELPRCVDPDDSMASFDESCRVAPAPAPGVEDRAARR